MRFTRKICTTVLIMLLALLQLQAIPIKSIGNDRDRATAEQKALQNLESTLQDLSPYLKGLDDPGIRHTTYFQNLDLFDLGEPTAWRRKEGYEVSYTIPDSAAERFIDRASELSSGISHDLLSNIYNNLYELGRLYRNYLEYESCVSIAEVLTNGNYERKDPWMSFTTFEGYYRQMLTNKDGEGELYSEDLQFLDACRERESIARLENVSVIDRNKLMSLLQNQKTGSVPNSTSTARMLDDIALNRKSYENAVSEASDNILKISYELPSNMPEDEVAKAKAIQECNMAYNDKVRSIAAATSKSVAKINNRTEYQLDKLQKSVFNASSRDGHAYLMLDDYDYGTNEFIAHLAFWDKDMQEFEEIRIPFQTMTGYEAPGANSSEHSKLRDEIRLIIEFGRIFPDAYAVNVSFTMAGSLLSDNYTMRISNMQMVRLHDSANTYQTIERTVSVHRPQDSRCIMGEYVIPVELKEEALSDDILTMEAQNTQAAERDKIAADAAKKAEKERKAREKALNFKRKENNYLHYIPSVGFDATFSYDSNLESSIRNMDINFEFTIPNGQKSNLGHGILLGGQFPLSSDSDLPYEFNNLSSFYFGYSLNQVLSELFYLSYQARIHVVTAYTPFEHEEVTYGGFEMTAGINMNYEMFCRVQARAGFAVMPNSLGEFSFQPVFKIGCAFNGLGLLAIFL